MVYLLLLPALYLLYVLVALLLQERVVFPGALTERPATRPGPHLVERTALMPEEGVRVDVWIIRGLGRTAASPGPAVIYFHGNAERIDDGLDVAWLYRDLGITTLLMEYRGYADSTGSPSQRAIVRDAVASHDLLAERPEVDPERIFLHGRSIGGGVACALAAERTPAALVLESTFISMRAMFASRGVPPVLCRHPFRSDEVLRELERPVLIVHGNSDGIVPVRHGRRLSEIARDATYLEVDGLGHLDLLPTAPPVRAAIERFLAAEGLLPAKAR